MGIKINGCSVSPRELDILHILWAAGTPLLASEIMESNDELRLATVHTTLTRMLKKNLQRKKNFLQKILPHFSVSICSF